MRQDDLSDIRRRLRAVERDSAPARVVAGAADRDVAEIRVEICDFRNAPAAGFNALRQDFVDRGQDFVGLREEHVDRRFEQVDRGFAEMRRNFDGTAAGQQRIVEFIESLIDQQKR